MMGKLVFLFSGFRFGGVLVRLQRCCFAGFKKKAAEHGEVVARLVQDNEFAFLSKYLKSPRSRPSSLQ